MLISRHNDALFIHRHLSTDARTRCWTRNTDTAAAAAVGNALVTAAAVGNALVTAAPVSNALVTTTAAVGNALVTTAAVGNALVTAAASDTTATVHSTSICSNINSIHECC